MYSTDATSISVALRRPRRVLLTDAEFFPKFGFRILATSEYVRSSSPQRLRFFIRGFFQCLLASAYYMAMLRFYGVLTRALLRDSGV